MLRLVVPLALCLAVCLCDTPFNIVTSLDQIVPGDPYDMRLPVIGIDLTGVRVAILTADKTEDVEGIYPLNYFLDRHASVDTICPDTAADFNNMVFASDFTKPSHSVVCDHLASDLSAADWLEYDAVIIVGGAGVYNIRNDSALMR
ncbi:hypothetical protein KIPB_008623, partial [Kipferlia bialata]|eukprot:g8623.t1